MECVSCDACGEVSSGYKDGDSHGCGGMFKSIANENPKCPNGCGYLIEDSTGTPEDNNWLECPDCGHTRDLL